jgi:hypothetical protein
MPRLSLTVFIAGCSLACSVPACRRAERFEAVAGTVIFADGQPVSGGVVEFDPLDPAGRPARGAIGPTGGFTLKSGATTGARPGRYRVAVVHVLIDSGAGHRHGHRRVHPRFSRFDTSNITVEVLADTTNAPRIVVESLESASGR